MAKAADSGEVGFDQKRAVDVYTKQLERQQ
jgi:hypothetical protein